MSCDPSNIVVVHVCCDGHVTDDVRVSPFRRFMTASETTEGAVAVHCKGVCVCVVCVCVCVRACVRVHVRVCLLDYNNMHS